MSSAPNVAVLIGIDAYPTAPLASCRADIAAVRSAIEHQDITYRVIELVDQRAELVASEPSQLKLGRFRRHLYAPYQVLRLWVTAVRAATHSFALPP